MPLLLTVEFMAPTERVMLRRLSILVVEGRAEGRKKRLGPD